MFRLFYFAIKWSPKIYSSVNSAKSCEPFEKPNWTFSMLFNWQVMVKAPNKHHIFNTMRPRTLCLGFVSSLTLLSLFLLGTSSFDSAGIIDRNILSTCLFPVGNPIVINIKKNRYNNSWIYLIEKHHFYQIFY